MKFNLQILVLIFIFLALQQNSFSVARRVKKVSHVSTTKKEMADSNCFSLPKEIAAVERVARKLRAEATKKGKSNSHRKGEEEEDKSIMAFSSDYHPPKQHPPKNN